MEAMSNPNDPFAPMHAVVKNEDSLWSNGILYYVLDSSLNGTYIHQLIISLYNSIFCVNVIYVVPLLSLL